MSGFKCRKVEDRFDDFIAGKLPDKKRVSVEMHLGTCSRCRESLEIWKGFISSVKSNAMDPLPPLVERRLVIAAAAERVAPSKNTNWKPWFAVASGAAVGAIVAVVFAVLLNNDKSDEISKPVYAQRVSDTGQSTLRTTPVKPEISTTADGRRVVTAAPGTNLWIASGADVQIESITAGSARFKLNVGRVVAEVNAPVKGYRFIVSTPKGEVEAKGTIFSVEVAPDGKETARVIRGVVELREKPKQGDVLPQPLTLRKGEEGVIGASVSTSAEKADLELDWRLVKGDEDYPRKPSTTETAGVKEADSAGQTASRPRNGESKATGKEDAPESVELPESAAEFDRGKIDDLVSLALAYRKAGNYKEAADTYGRLISEFSSSAASRNALVSLGQLELVEMARPEDSLVHFNDYLAKAPNGFLAEEARLGKVRACNRLNRFNDVESAAGEYLEAHPAGYAGAEVIRLRADAKVKLGDCEGAIEDYRRLKLSWPHSRQNELAAKGLEACGH